jgi:hypothetical protein
LCIVLLASGCANEKVAQKAASLDVADAVTAVEVALPDSAEPAEEETPAQATEVIPAQDDKSINNLEQADSKPQESAVPTATAAPPATTQNSGAASNTTVGSGGSNNGNNAPAPTADPNAGLTWHDAVYEDVWVVDIPASSYEEPVYEWKSRAICNTCEADITADIVGHGKSHTLNEENFSYKGEDYEVQTGTRTVNVPEQGHFEKKLVREAGYY